jgi:hypothetical protein
MKKPITDVSRAVSNSAQNVTPDVSLQPELGVTSVQPKLDEFGRMRWWLPPKACAVCGSSFDPLNGIQRFCSSACRQRAYRQSPAHRAVLDGKKQQRHNRRLYQHREKFRACSIGFDARFGGPVNESVPSVGMLDLKRFSRNKSKE